MKQTESEVYLMHLTEEQIYQEAKLLTDRSKERLAEKLFSDVASHIDSGIIKSHLEEVEKRFQDLESKKTKLIDGEKVSQKIRKLIDS